jgi:effector-binding domain-containing protein
MTDISLTHESPRPLLGIRRTVPLAELGAFFAEALPAVAKHLAERGLAPASPPMAVWWSMDMAAQVADCQAGFQLPEPTDGAGDITADHTAGGDVLVAVHRGPYDTVGTTWQALHAHAAGLGRTPGAGWELYVDDPGDTPAAELRTALHLPLSD